MEKCMEQGFLPDTISTDLYSANIHGPVYDLPTTLSKFLLLGMSPREVLISDSEIEEHCSVLIR
jgi:dihydroorotase